MLLNSEGLRNVQGNLLGKYGIVFDGLTKLSMVGGGLKYEPLLHC